MFKLGWLLCVTVALAGVFGQVCASELNFKVPEGAPVLSLPTVASEVSSEQVSSPVAEAKTPSDPEVNAFFPSGNVVSPEQKVLLLKEQEIVSQESVAPVAPVAQKDDKLAAKTAAKAPAPIYNSVPYSKPQAFVPNPLISGEVRLAYRPAVLDPMGEDKPKRSVIHPPEPAKAEEKAVAKKEDPKPVVVAEVSAPKDENPALTAFLEWVRSTNDAAEVARKEVEKKTQVAKNSGASGMFDNDLFLTIRFPYTGAEPPPTNSKTVYSEPPVIK